MANYLDSGYELETQRQAVDEPTVPFEFSVGFLNGNTLTPDKRVTILPYTVETLTENNVAVRVCRGLGKPLGLIDLDYADAGAVIEDEVRFVYRKSTVLVKLAPFSLEETALLQDGQVIVSPVSAAQLSPEMIALLQIKNITALSLKLVKNVENGELLDDILHVPEGNWAASAALGDFILSLIFPLLTRAELHSAIIENPTLAQAIYCYKGVMSSL